MFKLDQDSKDKEKRAVPSLSGIQDQQAGRKDDFQLNSRRRKKFRGFGTTQRRRKWGTTTPLQFTGHLEKEKLETDAMFKLDQDSKDKEKRAVPSLSGIQDQQAGRKDDFQLNSRRRRKKFRRRRRKWRTTTPLQFTEHLEKEKLETDAMFKLDQDSKDKEKRAVPSLSEIQEQQARWKDDFQLNSSLRKKFRAEKKVLAEQEEKDNAVRARTNLSIPLLPEIEQDKRQAALLARPTPDSCDDRQQRKRQEILSRPLFGPSPPSPKGAAQRVLLKVAQQATMAAFAKAMRPFPGPLVRKRTTSASGPEHKTTDAGALTRKETAATVTREAADCERRTGEDGEEKQNRHLNILEKKCSLAGNTSLVPDYSDSDSDGEH